MRTNLTMHFAGIVSAFFAAVLSASVSFDAVAAPITGGGCFIRLRSTE